MQAGQETCVAVSMSVVVFVFFFEIEVKKLSIGLFFFVAMFVNLFLCSMPAVPLSWWRFKLQLCVCGERRT